MKIEAEKDNPARRAFLRFPVAKMVIIRTNKTAKAQGLIASIAAAPITKGMVNLLLFVSLLFGFLAIPLLIDWLCLK